MREVDEMLQFAQKMRSAEESASLVYFRQETRYGTATAGLPRRGFSEPGRMPVRLAKSSGRYDDLLVPAI
jgi:hypothetical protein